MANNLEKTIIDERTGWEYDLIGNYYYPTGRIKRSGVLTPKDVSEDNDIEAENHPIRIWGQQHLRYIMRHRKILYTNLLTSGRLNGYLADLDKQAEDMFFRLVKQMAEREGVTEQLKVDKQMEWVARMNNIRSRVTELVNNDMIYI